jgi:hypothetical protein
VHAGKSLEWPVGIRHHGETSSRRGSTRMAKSLEETMEQIAKAVCKICWAAGWEKHYEAGLAKIRVSVVGGKCWSASLWVHQI